MHVRQVAAAIIQVDDKLLIARRAKEDQFKGLWEFPGGKAEAGETLEECLCRELKEELGIKARVGESLCAVDFVNPKTNSPMQIVAFWILGFDGEIVLHEHAEIAWVSANDLLNYKFPGPDYTIIDAICKNVVEK
jgi:mutator protein MutT